MVPVITVDAKGRITSVSTANVSNSLGTFKLQVGDGATSEQTVSLNNATRFVGTSNEITTAISTADDGATPETMDEFLKVLTGMLTEKPDSIEDLKILIDMVEHEGTTKSRRRCYETGSKS